MASNTIVDMPKVTQMLDNGWNITVFKNEIGTYTAQGTHRRLDHWEAVKERLVADFVANGWEDGDAREIIDIDLDVPGEIRTDDVTPEQAMTRLAYKVRGEII
jgi:hypothetical protein